MPALPRFKYHPDPIGTGMVVPSETTCACCDRARGYVYAGPVYAVEEYDDEICPWCIADGSAHQRLDATFTDTLSVGGWKSDRVPEEVVAEVACRTPGFVGWQQEQWWTHCGDAAAFLGRMGREELEAAGEAAIEAIRSDTGLSGAEWTGFFRALEQDGSPTAYLFRCRHCGAFGGYQDSK